MAIRIVRPDQEYTRMVRTLMDKQAGREVVLQSVTSS